MRISDWSSDVCSSDLKGRRRDRQPTVRPSANQSRKGIAIETDGFIDCRELSLGRLDAALGLLHRGAGFKTGVEASHDKIAGLAADARGIRRIAPALQQLGAIHIGCRNRRRAREARAEERRVGKEGGGTW